MSAILTIGDQIFKTRSLIKSIRQLSTSVAYSISVFKETPTQVAIGRDFQGIYKRGH